MKLESAPKSVIDIYYLANTPTFLYSMLRNDSFVQLISQESAPNLIKAFKEKSSQPISKMEDMALMYAIFVSLTFKEMTEVGDFFRQSIDKIQYEWFPDLAKFFLSNYIPAPIIQSVQIPHSPVTVQSIIIPSGDTKYTTVLK